MGAEAIGKVINRPPLHKRRLASRFKVRNALSSSPSSGCVAIFPPLALRRCETVIDTINVGNTPIYPAILDIAPVPEITSEVLRRMAM